MAARQQSDGLRLRALVAAAMAASIMGCGGGVTDDSNGAAAHLVCPKKCTSSGSLATDQIRPSYAIVGDGQRVQAQAGFNTGSDPRFNVELDGGDSLRLVTPQGTQLFHIPASSLGTVVVDAFKTLLFGASPYLSEVTPSLAPMPVQFQFVRGTAVFTSAVTLPAPFQIAAPAAGVVMPIATRTVPVRLTSLDEGMLNSASLDCADANGNTASGSATLNLVPGSRVSDATGTAYQVDLGTAIDGLSFTTTHPRGAVVRCDGVLTFTLEADGQPDARFANPRVFAQQIRKVGFALR